jgi:integrase
VSASQASPFDPFRRHKTRHRGVSYREKANGERTYSIYWKGRYITAGNMEKAALAMLSDYRRGDARGEAPILPTKTTGGELLEQWYVGKEARLRKHTAKDYRAALDLVLLPRFGSWKVAAIGADAISKLTRDLEREGLHAIDPERPKRPLGRASIVNYLKPLQGALALAVRRRLIGSNPFDHLTADDRPTREEKAPPFEWSDDRLAALLAGSEVVARKPESRYDYTPLLRLTATLGPRLGEVLGLQWQDFDKDTGTLSICRQWTRAGEYGPTKTKAGTRRIALPSDLRDELIALRLCSQYSQDDDPIFASQAGTPLGHRNVTRRGFEAAAKEAGLEGISFHDLRSAAASRLIRAGLDPVTVANVLGHENANITLSIYAHLFNRERTDDAVRLALAGGGAS